VARRPYTTVHLPPDLGQELDRYLQANRWGYRSRGEVVAEAVRTFLRKEHEYEISRRSLQDEAEST
jgi:metal-responsive CopG/Arc/MetJ family transcriptional regulator